MLKSLLFLTVILTTAVPCWAAVVRLVEDAPGQYRLQGEQLEGVAAFDLVVTYDANTLLLTNVSQGSLLQDTLFAGNPNQPGRVHIGAASTQPVSGSGTLASVSGTVNNPPVRILSVIAKIHDSSGLALQVSTAFPKTDITQDQAPPEETPTEEVDTSISSTETNDRSSGLVSTGGVDITTPWQTDGEGGDVSTGNPEPYVPPSKIDGYSGRSSARNTESDVPYVDKRQVRILSVLRAFEQYVGPQTLETLRVLFQQESDFQQHPEILLADGKASLEVEFSIDGNNVPGIALRNAQLLKAGSVGDNRYRIRCVPKKGALSAKVMFLGSAELMEIPLTVAPPVSLAELDISEDQDLPLIDLDGDGEVTWKDTYILVANLIVQGNTTK